MSRFSFIDENVNITGKQCFCIDSNSLKQVFINTSPSPSPSPNQNHSTLEQQINQTYLISPQTKNDSISEHRKQFMKTMNDLLLETYMNIKDVSLNTNLNNDENFVTRGKKTYRNKDNLSILEGFSNNKCKNICKSGKNRQRQMQYFNLSNILILLIILVLIVTCFIQK
jgi:hypothetical protein